MKRGWMRFSRKGSAIGRLRLAALWLALPLLRAPLPVQAQLRDAAAKTRPANEAGDQTRNDELTLAGLRPGRDTMTKALRHFSKGPAIGDGGASRTWRDDCRHETLAVIADAAGAIIEVHVGESSIEGGAPSKHGCRNPNAEATARWATGHGLQIGDACARVLALYGQPGSRGPSTKSGQQLELLYYAFDWAGADVPQVMTVLCTPEKEDKPGRVIEITLAAASL